MEKRIRIIWLLSLLSAFLLILVQGYWLKNQYELELDSFGKTASKEMLNVASREMAVRSRNVSEVQTLIKIKRDTDIAFDKGQSLSESKWAVLMNIDSLNQNRVLVDTIYSQQYYFDDSYSESELTAYVSNVAVNYSNPFQLQLLDSVLRADIPQTRFNLIPFEGEKSDSIYTSGYELTHSIFTPKLLVYYAYSPLERKGVYIETDIPLEGVFMQMFAQLAVSLLLLLLLIGCFIFQIKTILKQYKIGAMRQHFVNTMIHELKRPVQMLKMSIAYLSDEQMHTDRAMTGEVLKDSMFELDNLSAYLTKLKDVVRMDGETTPLNLSAFNLEELIEKTMHLINIPEEKQVTFQSTYDMVTPMVKADPVHLAAVVTNLIENAIKYSGEKVHINIDVSKLGSNLAIAVQDNGIGIPSSEQSRVFERFYRGSNIPDLSIPGLGLGLSYVKLISEAHNGQVMLSSCLGQGTTITLILPQ